MDCHYFMKYRSAAVSTGGRPLEGTSLRFAASLSSRRHGDPRRKGRFGFCAPGTWAGCEDCRQYRLLWTAPEVECEGRARFADGLGGSVGQRPGRQLYDGSGFVTGSRIMAAPRALG